jgi:hypothetical protein
MKAHQDFADFVSALNKNDVEYVIVGAYALAFHGHPRATGDIDFWIRPSASNAALLLDALKDFGFGALDISTDDILSGKIVQLGFPPVRIDLITKLDGLGVDEILKSKAQGKFGEHTVWYLGRSAFIKNKRIAGRYKDLADLELLGEKIEKKTGE